MNTTNTLSLAKPNPFRLLLKWFTPVRQPERPATPSVTVIPRASADTAPTNVAPRKKVLVVDDDPIILKTTSLKLQARGYTVLTARDGAEAIQTVRREKPDLILLDISFPVDAGGGAAAWDGFLIMSWLRRLEEAKHIPIIVITGGDPVKYKDRSLATGAVDFFHKPLDHDNLLAVVDRAVEIKNKPATAGSVANFQI
jgi:CheY-like chemotaxis protein